MAIFNTVYMRKAQEQVIWFSPEMMTNESPVPFTVVADSEYVSKTDGARYYAYLAFDGDQSTCWYSANQNAWIQIDFGNETRVKAFRMLPDTARFDPKFFPKEVTVSGSNDGETWTEIVVDSGIFYTPSSDWRVIVLDDVVSYRYYKFSFGLAYNGVGQSIISEIEFNLLIKEVTA